MINVIKVKYAKKGLDGMFETSPTSYTFYAPYPVQVGDDIIIRMHSNGEPQYGIVTEIDVPVEEILRFGDGAKTIVGKVTEA